LLFFYKVRELFLFTVTKTDKLLLQCCYYKDVKIRVNVASDIIMIQHFVKQNLTFVKEIQMILDFVLRILNCHQGAKAQSFIKMLLFPQSSLLTPILSRAQV